MGSSQATALTRATSSGGKTARSARSPLILEPFQPRFAEASSPATHRLPAHAQPLADLDVAPALGRQKHEPRALYIPMGPRVAGDAVLQLGTLCVAQHDLVGAASGHRAPDSPPPALILQVWRDFRRRALRPGVISVRDHHHPPECFRASLCFATSTTPTRCPRRRDPRPRLDRRGTACPGSWSAPAPFRATSGRSG